MFFYRDTYNSFSTRLVFFYFKAISEGNWQKKVGNTKKWIANDLFSSESLHLSISSSTYKRFIKCNKIFNNWHAHVTILSASTSAKSSLIIKYSAIVYHPRQSENTHRLLAQQVFVIIIYTFPTLRMRGWKIFTKTSPAKNARTENHRRYISFL